MANKAAQIPILDENTVPGCTQYYVVRYRGVGQDIWATLSPNPLRSPITIDNLFAGGLYEVEITRICCSGMESSPLLINLSVPA